MIVINMKNHIRDGVIQSVCDWWATAMEAAGIKITNRHRVPLGGDQNVARSRSQGKTTVEYEELIVGVTPPRTPTP